MGAVNHVSIREDVTVRINNDTRTDILLFAEYDFRTSGAIPSWVAMIGLFLRDFFGKDGNPRKEGANSDSVDPLSQ